MVEGTPHACTPRHRRLETKQREMQSDGSGPLKLEIKEIVRITGTEDEGEDDITEDAVRVDYIRKALEYLQ